MAWDNDPAKRARQGKYATKEHRDARVRMRALVASGSAVCWRCSRPIAVDAKWHVGHNDVGDRIMGPEHQSCNMRAAARKGARVANARGRARREGRPVTVRDDGMDAIFKRPIR